MNNPQSKISISLIWEATSWSLFVGFLNVNFAAFYICSDEFLKCTITEWWLYGMIVLVMYVIHLIIQFTLSLLTSNFISFKKIRFYRASSVEVLVISLSIMAMLYVSIFGGCAYLAGINFTHSEPITGIALFSLPYLIACLTFIARLQQNCWEQEE